MPSCETTLSCMVLGLASSPCFDSSSAMTNGFGGGRPSNVREEAACAAEEGERRDDSRRFAPPRALLVPKLTAFRNFSPNILFLQSIALCRTGCGVF